MTERKPEPSYGPDEEGELPIEPDGKLHDRASWVHTRHRKPPAREADEPE